MSKPAIIIVLGAAAMALAVVFGMFAHDDRRGKRTVSPPSEAQEAVTEPTPSVAADAVREPASTLAAPVPATPPRHRRPAEPPAPERLDEQSLIAKLQDLSASDPHQSLELAREALARFPDSRHAPEFEWNVVKALANMDRYEDAEKEARVMLEKYPGNPLSVDVEHHLLNHPPNPPNTP